MNLPHLYPVLFARKVLKKNKNSLHVECHFPCPPTLAMLLEAAAQSSAGFEQSEQKEVFLVAANNLTLYAKCDEKYVIVVLKREAEMSNMKKFSFEVKDKAKGEFTIYVK